jgi:carbamoyltransferase
MKVLGINVSNNGSVCLLKDGQVDFYLEAERITRKKLDYTVKDLVDYVNDVDIIAVVDAHWVLPEKNMITARDISKFKRAFPNAKFIDYRKFHHLAHAAGGFYNSGFDEAACIVVDSNGSSHLDMVEIETIIHAKTGNRFQWKTVHKKYWEPGENGIGKLFEGISKFCGFGNDDAGKVMGLAAYGSKIVDLYNTAGSSKEDAAYTIQTLWEERALELANLALNKTKCKNLVLSGGCFLNCVVNYKLRKELPDDIKIYVEPIAHDGGTAIGAAYLAYYNPKIKNS